MKTEKRWKGTWPTICDYCNIDLTQQTVFFDAQTIYGPWALMCPACWAKKSVLSLGIGYGQMYDSKTLIKLGG